MKKLNGPTIYEIKPFFFLDAWKLLKIWKSKKVNIVIATASGHAKTKKDEGKK